MQSASEFVVGRNRSAVHANRTFFDGQLQSVRAARAIARIAHPRKRFKQKRKEFVRNSRTMIANSYLQPVSAISMPVEGQRDRCALGRVAQCIAHDVFYGAAE